MTTERFREDDPPIQAATTELKILIRAAYPEARFETFVGEDPEGVYLRTTVDVDATDEVYNVVVDRLLELQVEDQLPIYVVIVRPLERVTANLEAERMKRAPMVAHQPIQH